ncbi:MAG: aspartate 1-decarboxylase [Anaerolineales bacterium]|jgi:aspartate 1-decarboxylase
MKGEAPRPIAPSWLRGKTRQARGTAAPLDYEVNLTLDMALLEAAGISELERIRGVDPEPGRRLAIYALPPPHGSGMIQVNGAATHLILRGDPVLMPMP